MMILLNSEKQCIYMYRGKRRRMKRRRPGGEEEKGGKKRGWSTTQQPRTYPKTTNLCKKCNH
jgi:hypothetical protein